MIYVTLGTQKFQMDRLLKKLDKLIDENIIKEDLIVQCVTHDYKPCNFEIRNLITKDEVDKLVKNASIVITHSGTGSLIKCNEYKKKTIIIPRLKKYKEHVDDHQSEIAEVFKKKVNATVVYNIEELNKYISNSNLITTMDLKLDNKSLLSSIEEKLENYLIKSKNKVVLIGSSLEDKGGIATVINNVYKSDLRNEFEMKHIATYTSESVWKWISLYLLSLIKVVYFCIFKDEYSIFHIHVSYKGSFYRKFIIIYLLKLFNKKTVVHFHGSESEAFYKSLDKGFKEKVRKKFFDNIDILIVLSESWKKFFSNYTDVNKIKVVSNAVKLPIKVDEKTYSELKILFLGRFGKRKGIYDLLDVLKQIKDETLIDIEVYLGGDGEIDEVNKLIKTYELTNIKNLGWVNLERKLELLNWANLFVLPSYNEGLPMAVLEAMSYKCAIISSKVGGIPEVIKNGENGFLITAGNKNELQKSIIYFMQNKSELKKMGENSRNLIECKFSEEKMLFSLKNIYSELFT